MIETAPLLSGDGVPQVAKIGLGGLRGRRRLPRGARPRATPMPDDGAGLRPPPRRRGHDRPHHGLLPVRSSTRPSPWPASSSPSRWASAPPRSTIPWPQIEIPLMGQFLNLIAMFVFVSTERLPEALPHGRAAAPSRRCAAIDLVPQPGRLRRSSSSAPMGALFQQALVLSLPILGTLFLVSVAMGLLSKAAPQMNLLSEGFPISIFVAFFVHARRPCPS